VRPDTGDFADFIRENLVVRPVSGRPDIRLYTAHPGSGLSRLGDETPYWAYVWPGGAAVAQHVLAQPDCIEGRTVLDLGSGGGLVGIAAAKAGAQRVICSEILPAGRAAIALNAALNGVAVDITGDMTGAGVPPVDLIAAGDTFYEPVLARLVLVFLRAATDAGVEVMIGDIGREFLPREALMPIGTYPVQEFGDGPNAPERPARVFRLR
jgi:predicted nicotinamide N-methyase